MNDLVYSPFSKLSQYAVWEDVNCGHCARWSPDASRCDIQAALADATWNGGEVNAEIAERMGYLAATKNETVPPPWGWRCGEFEPEQQEVSP